MRAHIVPRGFSRDFLGDGPNIQLSNAHIRPANPQLGQYDSEILCATCDQMLGRLDEYALSVCRKFSGNHTITPSGYFEMHEVDGDRFAKFVLAVLWRASVSQRNTFVDVTLGKHEEQARDILFNNKALAEMPAFRVFMQRYVSDHLDPSGIYTIPVRTKVYRRHGFGFALSGFRICAMLDDWPLHPATPRVELANGSRKLRGRVVRFEDTAEFDMAKNIVVAEAVRRGVPPWEL